MKFFLSLYGHRLPVLTLDVSTDGTLLVTGSADKNVKIWGLDFGDCHKSMFAHQDNVMAVKFVPRTHYFFSAGKDKLIKMWDADKFVQITTIRAHYADHAWRDDPNGALLAAWQQGKTGYPMVDAGMRELWHTGWMHQNVRMITASFLTEYMGMNWVDGERWYADTLVDADAAINAMM